MDFVIVIEYNSNDCLLSTDMARYLLKVRPYSHLLTFVLCIADIFTLDCYCISSFYFIPITDCFVLIIDYFIPPVTVISYALLILVLKEAFFFKCSAYVSISTLYLDRYCSSQSLSELSIRELLSTVKEVSIYYIFAFHLRCNIPFTNVLNKISVSTLYSIPVLYDKYCF